MTVTATSIAGRTVTLSGTVSQMSQAFAVDLGHYKSEDSDYRGRDGFVYVPRELSAIVRGVFGLDNRRVGFRNSGDPPGTTSLSPTLVAEAYNFPQGTPDATSQRIGVVEFAVPPGGWNLTDVSNTLTQALWGAVSTTPIDVGTGNTMTSDGETILDICTASAVAPGATIQVYWGNDSLTAQDWFTIIDRIWHNPQKGDPPAPQILSISWTLIGGRGVAFQVRGIHACRHLQLCFSYDVWIDATPRNPALIQHVGANPPQERATRAGAAVGRVVRLGLRKTTSEPVVAILQCGSPPKWVMVCFTLLRSVAAASPLFSCSLRTPLGWIIGQQALKQATLSYLLLFVRRRDPGACLPMSSAVIDNSLSELLEKAKQAGKRPPLRKVTVMH
jgi:hypothetical protein